MREEVPKGLINELMISNFFKILKREFKINEWIYTMRKRPLL